MDCSDGNSCTLNTCDAENGCETDVLFNQPCNDGDARTTGDLCQGATCNGTGTLACDDGNVCTTDQCASGSGCVHPPVAGPCDDGDDCMEGDVCANGECTGTPTVVCEDDGNPCTLETCVAG